MDLFELWDRFEEVNSEEANEGRLIDIINSILDEKALFLLDFICFFLEKYHSIGNLRAYSKQEIKENFPWKKSQLQFLLRKAINQKIVIYYQRKYLLNIENSLVKRLWSFYFALENRRNKIKDLDANFRLVNENRKLREEIALIQSELNKNNNTKLGINLEKISNEISSTLSDSFDPKETLFMIWKNKISFIVNFKNNI